MVVQSNLGKCRSQKQNESAKWLIHLFLPASRLQKHRHPNCFPAQQEKDKRVPMLLVTEL